MARGRETLLCVVWIYVTVCTFVDGQNWWQAEPVDRDIVWRKSDSPITIRDSMWFLGPPQGRPSDSGATLRIEPGTEVRFGPGVMLAFNGTLIAQGTPEEPILFTKLEPESGPKVPQWPKDIRLVDDRSVAYGRLQMNHQGRWRGICANFQNWTKDDTDVACRQLGFQWGNFSFFSWSRNDSLFMLYHRPRCEGYENSLYDCPGVGDIKIGARICEGQQTIHLHCYGLAPESPAKDYWWGMEFYNSSNVPTSDGTHFINESSSILQNVIFQYGGVDRYGSAVPTLRASPHAPHLINVTIRHCALDATNFTEIRGSTIVRNSLFENNRGHGFVAETHLGRMTITDSHSLGNYGDGMKTKFLDGNYPIFDERETFCRRSNIRGGFPLLISGIPSLSPPCETWFETDTSERITLNILEMDIEDEARAHLEVYDGRECNWSPLLEKIPIVNGTFPRGITTKFHQMCVRFVWEQLPAACPALRDCVKFTILVDSGPESVPELFMNNTHILNNTQTGLFIENVRNYVYVNASEISHNHYSAGLRVFGGAGDVHVNASVLNYNQENGVNITYEGGLRIFNMSDFSNNFGNGINITLNETRVDNKTRYSLSMFNTQGRDGPSRRIERTEVSNSNFVLNNGFGVRVANSCRAGIAVVNDSSFIENRREAVEFESCFQIIPNNNITNFTVGYNTFDGNYGHAIRVSPLINTVGRIANNTFLNHPRHVIKLDNTDDFLFNRHWAGMLVDYEVDGNEFYNNRGFYVINVRLTEGGMRQQMAVKHNVFKENVIEGAFPTLNERTRAFAVAIVSSSNINFSRNHLTNVRSKYELATHLLDKSVTIEATRQWWGTTDYLNIIERIFDQFSRFNLGKIDYHPVLRYDDLWGPWITDQQRPEEIKFDRGDTLGGRLASQFTTVPGMTYTIDRDVSIIGFGHFRISAGTTLNFGNALGMLVQDRLEADGTEQQPIMMKLLNETTVANSTWVRLVDGDTEMEGRVEVRPSEGEDWGTVCNLGWSIKDASVVCQMLGLVVHPSDWGQHVGKPGPGDQPIWRSYVQCNELDMNIIDCEADQENDHSCTHEQDVFVRCKPPTWAGISFLATAASSRIRHTTITNAGLMDPTAILYSPALRIDYNIHTLEHLNIIDNMDDGVEILRNDVYANARITHSTVARNFGNGISTRGSFFQLYMCKLEDNERAGFMYNPHYTTYEAQQMRAGIQNPYMLDANKTYNLANEAFVFWATPVKLTPETQTYQLEVQVAALHRVVMDILDYDPGTGQENITVFDSRVESIKDTTHRWMIEDDLVDFPVVSSGTFLTVRWRVSGTASGRFTFVLRSRPHNWRWPFAEIRVRNTTTSGNEQGVVTKHYNQPSNEYLDLFFRFRWETVQMFGVTFEKNRFEALHAPSITKYHELYLPSFEELQDSHRLAEINYEIDNCHFEENGGGVVAEHNHVEFSNNIWIWEVTHSRFERNYDGGYKIELPRVNLMFTELFNHSVDINDTIFENNDNFEFRIDGFYCNSSIARNRFQGNKCKLGCITIAGTEKDAEIFDNEFVENVGKYILEVNMNSHTPYNQWVEMSIQFNNFKRNVKADNLPPPVASRPTSYTLGIKGLQNVTIIRNLFGNSLDFEVVGGMSSSMLENYLDVRENWWGTADQEIIRERIFDFDDWNSYAIAEYYPYLLGNNFDSQVATGGRIQPILDLSKPFGGRIEQYTEFHARTEPYIVRSDLTIMPTASILIHPGAEFQFFPNIGILVLGSMTARGTPNNKIKFGPVPREHYGIVAMYNNNTHFPAGGAANAAGRRRKRQIMGGKSDVLQDLDYQVRLNGGDNEYEGFIELYNATERRWTIICDDQFHERTAEVACRTMGMESTNVAVRRTRWYDHFVLGFPLMHEQKIEWFWRRSFICDGREAELSQCRYRLNHHLRQCMEARQYVYVRCGPRNLAAEYDYWGNVRFSTPEYEHGEITPGASFLQQVDLYGAGILHEDYSAAVQAVHRISESNYVRISHCANNGYDYIAPRGEFAVINNVIENNNGYAVGGLILTGESRYEVPLSSFTPLVESTIPYNVFGMVRMCTTEKLIWIRDRLLLYFKYNFQTVDCIKIIRSREPRRQIALRFLQVNMFNDSFFRNAVEMYNGEYFDNELLLGTITSASPSRDRNIMYSTGNYFDAMGIRVTASAAHGEFGFIAEVVTLPLTPGWRPILGPGIRQRIAQCTITGNEGGGFHFSNAGELNPSVVIELNSVTKNGLKMLNMTTPPVVHMYIQNTRMVTLANNFINDNAGGVFLNTTTFSLTNALFCNITNNIINYNTHGTPLHLEGHHFQGVSCRDNYIAHNDVDHRNVMSMFGINLNFTSNIVTNNTGQTILNATVPELVSINQQYRVNSIHNNYAFAKNRSTIFLGSAKHSFRDNFLVNRWNVYEMVAFNRTRYDDGVYPEVVASDNWWGGGNLAFVSGRIWERGDDDNLIGVVFSPFYETNQSVLQGRCDPGWRLFEQRCFLYFGGVAPYHVAEQNCRRHRARLGWARDHHRERWLGEVVASAQENYDEFWMTWVFSERQQDGLCTVLLRNTISHIDCNAILPSICERDPYVSPIMDWHWIIIASSVAGGLLLIFIPICICFACLKARARNKQKVERRSVLRASMKASKASLYTGSVRHHQNQPEEVRYQKRRRPPLNKSDSSGVLELSGVTLDDTSDISTDKNYHKMMTLDSHRPSTPASTLDYSDSGKMETSTYFDSDLGPVRHRHHDNSHSSSQGGAMGGGGYQHPQQVENEIARYIPRPQPQYNHPSYQASQMDEMSLVGRGMAPSRGGYQDTPSRGYPSTRSYGGASDYEGASGFAAPAYNNQGRGGYGKGSGPSGSGMDTSGYTAHSGPANTSTYSYGNPSFQGNMSSSSYSGGRGGGAEQQGRAAHRASPKIDWDELHPPRARDERPPRPKPKESAM